jgi:hypothetical protein
MSHDDRGLDCIHAHCARIELSRGVSLPSGRLRQAGIKIGPAWIRIWQVVRPKIVTLAVFGIPANFNEVWRSRIKVETIDHMLLTLQVSCNLQSAVGPSLNGIPRQASYDIHLPTNLHFWKTRIVWLIFAKSTEIGTISRELELHLHKKPQPIPIRRWSRAHPVRWRSSKPYFTSP